MPSRQIDLRTIFERGIEPLSLILNAVSSLRSEEHLLLDAPFHPLPLRRLLEGRGFDSRASQIGPAHWRIEIRHRTAAK